MTAEMAPPRALFIEITSHCNMHCTFCPSDLLSRKKEHIQDGVLREFLRQVHELGFRPPVMLNVLGEPMLNKRLYEYLDLLEKEGHPVTLISNMTLLQDKLVVRELLKHNSLSLALSLQTANRKAFRMRGYGRIKFNDYFKIVFAVIEEKFQMASSARLEIHVASNYILRHDPTVQSDFNLNPWANFRNEKSEARWVGRLLDKLESFARIMKKKYPGQVAAEEALVSAKYREHIGPRIAVAHAPLPENFQHLKGEEFWGYMFLPNVFLQFKSLELWNRDRRFLERLVPRNGLLFVEEQRQAQPCIMAENLGILANGQIILCCLDYEGEMNLGNISTVKISDPAVAEKRQRIRNNAMTQAVCRRCRGHVLIFDRRPSGKRSQTVDKFGCGWQGYERGLAGLGGRWTTGHASAYVYTRSAFAKIQIKFFSIFENSVSFSLRIFSQNAGLNGFTKEYETSFYGAKEKMNQLEKPFAFEAGRLYRIDIATPTFIPDDLFGNGDKRSLGIAVISIQLRK